MSTDPLYNEDNPRLTADGWRELTAEEYIRTHMPEQYGAIAELVDLSMAHSDRPCIGDTCDDCHTCARHRFTTRIATRFVRLRDRAWLRAQLAAERLLAADPWSPEETAARLELERFRAAFADRVYSRATEEKLRVRWQRAFRVGNMPEDKEAAAVR